MAVVGSGSGHSSSQHPHTPPYLRPFLNTSSTPTHFGLGLAISNDETHERSSFPRFLHNAIIIITGFRRARFTTATTHGTHESLLKNILICNTLCHILAISKGHAHVRSVSPQSPSSSNVQSTSSSPSHVSSGQSP